MEIYLNGSLQKCLMDKHEIIRTVISTAVYAEINRKIGF